MDTLLLDCVGGSLLFLLPLKQFDTLKSCSLHDLLRCEKTDLVLAAWKYLVHYLGSSAVPLGVRRLLTSHVSSSFRQTLFRRSWIVFFVYFSCLRSFLYVCFLFSVHICLPNFILLSFVYFRAFSPQNFVSTSIKYPVHLCCLANRLSKHVFLS